LPGVLTGIYPEISSILKYITFAKDYGPDFVNITGTPESLNITATEGFIHAERGTINE